MKTLEEIFKENLKRLRGYRTQAAIAEAAGIPLRSYQHAESGIIPQGPNRTAIAHALGASEAELFVDFSAYMPKAGITPQEALEVLKGAIEAKDYFKPAKRSHSEVASEDADLLNRIGALSPEQQERLAVHIEAIEAEGALKGPRKARESAPQESKRKNGHKG